MNGQAAGGTNMRQFLVPPTSTLAHVVAESYYLLLANGLVQDLAAHYSPTAQKSCTVGGAHAICQKIEDRAMQLQSLVGLTVQIKGLLQQPTAGNGILVLITGMCIRPHALPFCQGWVKPADLPSNAEIRDEIQQLADLANLNPTISKTAANTDNGIIFSRPGIKITEIINKKP